MESVPWSWKIYPNDWVILQVIVDKYSSTMEQQSRVWKITGIIGAMVSIAMARITTGGVLNDPVS